MSILDNITRIEAAKIALETSIEAKGQDIAEGALIDAFPAAVNTIIGGTGAPTVVTTEEEVASFLTSENLGRLLRFMGENTENYRKDCLYKVVTREKIEVGDTITSIYFNTTKTIEETDEILKSLDWSVAQDVTSDFSPSETNTGKVSILPLIISESLEFLVVRFDNFNCEGDSEMLAGLYDGFWLPYFSNPAAYCSVNLLVESQSWPSTGWSTDESVLSQWQNLRSGTISYVAEGQEYWGQIVSSESNFSSPLKLAVQMIDEGDLGMKILDGTITSIFGSAMTIRDHAFDGCTYLTKVEFPKCSQIGRYAFNDCGLLSSVKIPNCERIGSSAFTECLALTSIDFPKCSYIEYSAFQSCLSLETISLPKVEYINDAFKGCRNLSFVYLPECRNLISNAFGSGLKVGSFPACSQIDIGAFYGSLSSLYLMSASKVSVYRSNYSASYYWTVSAIYVPMSLLSEYQADSFWSSKTLVGVE